MTTADGGPPTAAEREGGGRAPEHQPFGRGPRAGALCRRSIFLEGKPILRVVHDLDGDWQFLDGEVVPEDERPMIVSIADVCRTDPSVGALDNLPSGWCAERESPEAEWVRAPIEHV